MFKNSDKMVKFGNTVELDLEKCINCGACAAICSNIQKINYLQMDFSNPKDRKLLIQPDKERECIFCGQCTLVCPVEAVHEQVQIKEVQAILKDRGDKKVVVQFAPSIRASIGEEFGMPHGTVVTGQVVTALRKLGFDYVFDTNFGADITTMTEAQELVERIENHGVMPMTTSCCPGWVTYVETMHPELIPHLTTARSPQIHLGGVIKTYWADKAGLDPKKIVTVSIMPCTAKKFESDREEMKVNDGLLPTDYVLTNREFAYLMKEEGIDFSNLESSKADNPLGDYSGAGAIYGVSGGVMESALRTALCLMSEDGTCPLDYNEVRGMEGIKEATVDFRGRKIRVAVVNGIGNIEAVIQNLEKYDYIEVMACPGGCIGGGGQPRPTNNVIRKKRIEALYSIDKTKKWRKAHENQGVKEAMDWLKEKGLEHEVLHTHFVNRKK